MKATVLASVTFFAFALGSKSVLAQDLVTYRFSGSVTTADSVGEAPNPLGFSVAIGQEISGTLTYNLDAPGTILGERDGVPNLILYSSPRISLTYTIGGVTVNNVASVFVGNRAEVGGLIDNAVDTLFAVMDSELPSPLTAFVRLEDMTQTVFASAELPATVPLPSFDLRRFELQQRLADGSSHLYLTGTIRSFTRIGKEISIDIRPRSFPNQIDPQSDDTVPVAILTTNDADDAGTFDATRVNPMSVRFGGVGREVAAIRVEERDVDGDGDTDLVFRFKSRDIGLNCTDSSATLRGQTVAGRVVQGTDSVMVAGCSAAP